MSTTLVLSPAAVHARAVAARAAGRSTEKGLGADVNRRRFLITAAGTTTAAVAVPWLGTASAATDDELAYANFGVAASLLASDFYGKAIAAKVFDVKVNRRLRVARANANQHAAALGALLTGAGQTAPAAEDFTFAWPDGTFKSPAAAATAGLTVLRATLGAYQSAVASVSVPSYRTLYASLVASLAQQIGVLVTLVNDAVGAESFPNALDLEAASAALEDYLG